MFHGGFWSPFECDLNIENKNILKNIIIAIVEKIKKRYTKIKTLTIILYMLILHVKYKKLKNVNNTTKK